VERLLEEMAWHGPVMVEFRDDGGDTPCLMEVNGRFWGSVQLAVSCGIDVPAWWVAMLEGRQPAQVSAYREGVSLRWLWGDIKRLFKIYEGAPPGFPGRYPTFLEGLSEVFGSQPPGTTIETWDARDPLPAAAEWVQGAAELLGHAAGKLHAGNTRDPLLRPVKSGLASNR
jgi:predicted ATP-grasp superfamily ATP-dependent carboligase